MPSPHPHSIRESRERYRLLENRRGASLILVVVMMAALMVLMLIFARLMAAGGSITRSYSNVFKAEMAVKAGLADAENLLLELFSKYPDSVTYWEVRLGATTTPGTVFMYRDTAPNKITSGQAVKVYCRPLISGAATKEFYPANQYADTLASDATATGTNSIDINSTPDTSDNSKRWIGVLLGNKNTNQAIRVPWVEILQDSSQPKNENIDPDTGQAINPVVARYAYWVDDESFKLNVNSAQASLRGSSDTNASSGKTTWMASWRGWFDTGATAQSLEEVRTELKATNGKILSASQITHASSLPDTAEKFWTKWKPYLTADSSGLNLSRSGMKRLDINTAATAGDAQSSLERIIWAIKKNQPHFGQRFYRASTSVTTTASYPLSTSLKGSILNDMTGKNSGGVGVSTTVTAGSSFSHEEIYLYKLAANIRDYISNSPNPTVVKSNGAILAGSEVNSFTDLGITLPTGTSSVSNPVIAIGKKAIPYLTEYMMHVKATNVGAIPSTAPGPFEVEIDHYFEFWNPTTKTITAADLGTDPYIIIGNQPNISVSGNGSVSAPAEQEIPSSCRSFKIKLNEIPGLTFKPGSFTVITTDLHYNNYTADLGITSAYTATKFYSPKTGQSMSGTRSQAPYPSEGDETPVSNARLYSCICYYHDNNDPNRPLEVQIGPDWSSNNFIPYFIMGNSSGLLDAEPALRMSVPGSGKNNLVALRTDQSSNYRYSYVTGVQPLEGDPRTKMEALAINIFGATYSAAQAGYSNQGTSGNNGGVKSLGTFSPEMQPLSDSHNPASPRYIPFWPSDKAAAIADVNNAPMIIAKSKMTSIAELGHIYDPMRVAANPDDLDKVRGGGRTLTIGQPDELWDGTRSDNSDRGGMLKVNGTSQSIPYQLSNSRNWAAWRLCDLFTVRKNADMTGVDYESKTPQPDNYCEISGLYNPNGILRDEGAVLQALLRGITTDSTHPNLSAHGLTFEANSIVKTTDASLSSLIWSESDRSSTSDPRTTQSGGLAVANYAARRLTNTSGAPWRFSPFWEPGELSQLECFSDLTSYASNKYLDSTVANNALMDRERESVFRRLCEMMTPKGNTFSVYVVGQVFDKAGNITASKWQRIIVRLHPVWKSTLNDEFDTKTMTAVDARFSLPDLYRVEVVSVEDR